MARKPISRSSLWGSYIPIARTANLVARRVWDESGISSSARAGMDRYDG